MKKLRIFSMLLALCLLLVFPVAAAQTGSLAIRNVELPAVLYQVADAEGVLTREFAGAITGGLTQENISADKARSLSTYAREHSVSGQTGTPDTEGSILFTSLEEGYYLACSTGETGEFAPFLIRVPMTIHEKLVYDIQAEPKVQTPSDPSAPTETVPPQPNIPQTGNIQWPKYLLLILGAAAVAAGLFQVLYWRGKQHE